MHRHGIEGVADDEQKGKYIIALEAFDTDSPQADGKSENENEHADTVESPYLLEELMRLLGVFVLAIADHVRYWELYLRMGQSHREHTWLRWMYAQWNMQNLQTTKPYAQCKNDYQRHLIQRKVKRQKQDFPAQTPRVIRQPASPAQITASDAKTKLSISHLDRIEIGSATWVLHFLHSLARICGRGPVGST